MVQSLNGSITHSLNNNPAPLCMLRVLSGERFCSLALPCSLEGDMIPGVKEGAIYDELSDRPTYTVAV